jgi:translation initiation factor 4G
LLQIPLTNLLRPNSKTKETLSGILEEANLGFLMPLFQVQRQLADALLRDPSPTVFYRYIKDTVDESNFTDPSFIFALVSVVVKHIVHEVKQTSASDGGADAENESNLKAREKDMLAKFAPVLKAFLNERSKLQITAVYAVQSVCHAQEFPKGKFASNKWTVDFRRNRFCIYGKILVSLDGS